MIQFIYALIHLSWYRDDIVVTSRWRHFPAFLCATHPSLRLSHFLSVDSPLTRRSAASFVAFVAVVVIVLSSAFFCEYNTQKLVRCINQGNKLRGKFKTFTSLLLLLRLLRCHSASPSSSANLKIQHKTGRYELAASPCNHGANGVFLLAFCSRLRRSLRRHW